MRDKSITPDNIKHGRFKHGGTRTPEFIIWCGMKRRCYSPSAASYLLYSGRGIVVCDGWRNNFAAFIAAVGKRPHAKYSIERIDNNGNYSCGECEQCVKNKWAMNVKWATTAEQCRNRRSNR